MQVFNKHCAQWTHTQNVWGHSNWQDSENIATRQNSTIKFISAGKYFVSCVRPEWINKRNL